MAITQDYVDWATGNDYKGATFTDGAFTVADMTLTKAGAFAASKANHWLYLTDNGSNNVTDGYYRIASVTSANAVVLATSPKSGATDPTDVKCTQHAGTNALPWRSDQGACDLLTRNTTDGNQVNILAGSAVVHAAALDLTTFIAGGALSAAAPLILRGCTATADDGGIGEIDCGGYTMYAVATYTTVYMIHMKIHNGGNNHLISQANGGFWFECEFYSGASNPSNKYLLNVSYGTLAAGCYFHDPGEGASRCVTGATIVENCYCDMGTSSIGTAIYGSTKNSNCIVVCNNASQIGISGNFSTNCICYNTSAGVNSGISPTVGAVNNIIVGWSGVGGEGIVAGSNAQLLGHNAFYNNTSQYTLTDVIPCNIGNDVTLAADPFTDAANGDFSLTAEAKTALAAKGFPLAYLGAHANTVPNLNIGPIQMAAGGTGGGTVNLLHGKLG